MKGFRPWIFYALAIVSLAVCLFTPHERVGLNVGTLHWGSRCLRLDEYRGSLYWTKANDGYEHAAQGYWFSFGLQNGSTYWQATILAIPYWPVLYCIVVLALIRLAFPTFRFRNLPGMCVARLTARRRSRLQQQNRCQSCGYDLRASKDRCPECGTAIPERAAT